MRLIDADILLGYVNKYDTGQPIGKALRAMLGKSPTVDAVPVQWIENWIQSKGSQTVVGYHWIMMMLKDWAERKDNETD